VLNKMPKAKKQNLFVVPISKQIVEQQQSEGKPKIVFKPLKSPIIAESHTALYKMHRYFARRPHTVFNSLIRNYSNPGQIILDPFCGGGVTVVEGLKLKRKVIGVDINPTATFIARMEISNINIEELDKSKKVIEKVIGQRYLTCTKQSVRSAGKKQMRNGLNGLTS